MISFGSAISPIAITARWRMPPENSCGYCRTRASGIPIRTARNRSTARSCARPFEQFLVHLGDLGELAADAQRGVRARHRILVDDGERPAEQPSPLGVAEPARISPKSGEAAAEIRALAGSRSAIAIAVSVLPDPDSPDDADDLARRDRDADVPHGNRAAGKRHGQVVERQDRLPSGVGATARRTLVRIGAAGHGPTASARASGRSASIQSRLAARLREHLAEERERERGEGDCDRGPQRDDRRDEDAGRAPR